MRKKKEVDGVDAEDRKQQSKEAYGWLREEVGLKLR